MTSTPSSIAAAILAGATLLMAGCATIDYVPPATGPKATLTVTSANPAINTPVRVHPPLVCTNDTSKRVGWLNSRVAGAPPTGDTLTFDIPAGREVGVSVLPGSLAFVKAPPGEHGTRMEINYCDRVIDFTPVDGARYTLRAQLVSGGRCTYQLDRTDGGHSVPEPSAKVRETCTVPLN